MKKYIFISLSIIILTTFSCSKKMDGAITPTGAIKTIVYSVKGTNFNISYIDSNSAYKANQVYKDSFAYEFRKGSGANIGFTVHPQSPSDTVYSWIITIDGKLFANAFSEGGAFLSVPYN